MGLRKVDGEQRIKSNMCQLSHQNDDDVDDDYDDNDDDDDADEAVDDVLLLKKAVANVCESIHICCFGVDQF